MFLIERKNFVFKSLTYLVLPSLLEQCVRKYHEVVEIVVTPIPDVIDAGLLPAAVVVLPLNSTVTASDITKTIEGIFFST